MTKVSYYDLRFVRTRGVQSFPPLLSPLLPVKLTTPLKFKNFPDKKDDVLISIAFSYMHEWGKNNSFKSEASLMVNSCRVSRHVANAPTIAKRIYTRAVCYSSLECGICYVIYKAYQRFRHAVHRSNHVCVRSL